MPLPTVLPAPSPAAATLVPQVTASAGTVIAVVLGVIVLLVLLLAVTGFVAGRRRADAHRAELEERLRLANSALADAHAADEGWDLALLEAAARQAAIDRGVASPQGIELMLVSVDDQPGVSDDRATFDVVDGDRHLTIVLGRGADGAWSAVDAG
ncbi:MAG: hypothetical protein M0P31_14680 [Solirubrobacteraceae bacterium]|nr:hypothetical protein [Solirubrobacteraceae bacterium]